MADLCTISQSTAGMHAETARQTHLRAAPQQKIRTVNAVLGLVLRVQIFGLVCRL